MAEKKKKRKVGINKDGTLSKPWQKFFDKLDEINKSEIAPQKWDNIHVLGYICKLFREEYGTSFTFSLVGPPSKCPELYCVSRMRMMLGNPSNSQLLKDYVDWVFDRKIRGQNRPLKSMGLFITPGICNEFKFFLAKKNKVTRATKFPEQYIQIAETLGIDSDEVSTYGDVAFIKIALDKESDPNSRKQYREFLRHIESFGFNLNVLERLSNG